MTRPAEQFWAQAHGDAWVANYAASSFGPHRAIIGTALRYVAPYATVLDIGCNCGVLMPWLTAASPGVLVTGIDLSQEALENANRLWPQHTWVIDSIVDWLPAKEALGARWDVVVSSSCLEHVAPNDLRGVLDAMTGVAQKAIVLQEVTVTATMGEGVSKSVGVMEWRHDYVKRLEQRGWQCTSATPFGTDPTRPGSVLTFSKME